jgi:hypothetical protein
MLMQGGAIFRFDSAKNSRDEERIFVCAVRGRAPAPRECFHRDNRDNDQHLHDCSRAKQNIERMVNRRVSEFFYRKSTVWTCLKMAILALFFKFESGVVCQKII